jgi:phage regulator Rha-like protein
MKSISVIVQSMSSREIADMTGKRHDNVMQVIASLINAQVLTPEIKGSTFKHRGNEYNQWLLNKRDSLVLVARLSPEFTAIIVDRWQELESKELLESERKNSRQQAKLEAPLMTKALQDARARQGKESPPHVFSNDYDMIYRIVLGFPAKKYKIEQGIDDKTNLRDVLTLEQIKAIESLQRLNQSMHELDFDFEARKTKLNQVFMRNHAQPMIEEITRDNA